ncbi:MAG: HAMP domain-containing histidine kinase [Candidatus Riflebacteria bacterium]|nr:HAMP domain-containing histidine kinase [Candidatus Riflebacteria bacterium]
MKRWKFSGLLSPGLISILGLIGVFYFLIISGLAAYLVHLHQLQFKQNMMESAEQAPAALSDAVHWKMWNEADFILSVYENAFYKNEKKSSKLANTTLIHTIWNFDPSLREIQYINGSGSGKLDLSGNDDLFDGLSRIASLSAPISSEPIQFAFPRWNGYSTQKDEIRRIRKDTESDFIWVRKLQGEGGEWMMGVIFSAEALMKRVVIPEMESLCRKKNIELELFDEMCLPQVLCVGEKKDVSRASLIPMSPRKEPITKALNGFWLQTYVLEDDLEWSRRPFRILLMGISLGMGFIILFAFFYWFNRFRRQEEELRLQNDWILHLAHILRGPLHSLNMLIESFSAVSTSSEERNGLGECMRREIDRLDSSCLQFIRKAKANLGQLEVSLTNLELTPIVSGVMDRLSLRYPGLRERIVLEIPQEMRVLADAEALGELFENLLDNAVKYSPRGTLVTLAASAEESRVRIVIKDTGLGIPPELLPRIGEPFFRGGQKDADGIVGSGLGFHLSKNLCSRMGGVLNIESEGLDKGATVTFVLPSSHN